MSYEKIGVISDTHGMLDERIFEHFASCDEVWHAGDWARWKLSTNCKISNHFAAFGGISMVTKSVRFSPAQPVYVRRGESLAYTYWRLSRQL